MKYIKSYKIFESSNNLFSDIDDILIYVNDLYQYFIYDLKNIDLICIQIDTAIKNVQVDVDHLVSYMISIDYDYCINDSRDKIHLLFLKKSNKNNNIMKNFLNMIDGIRKIRNKAYPNSILFLDKENNVLFDQNSEYEIFYYDYSKIGKYFASEYSLRSYEIKLFVMYMVGKYMDITSYYINHGDDVPYFIKPEYNY